MATHKQTEASTMTVQLNQVPSWDQEVAYYQGVNGRIGRTSY
jgi:hypothetical protein